MAQIAFQMQQSFNSDLSDDFNTHAETKGFTDMLKNDPLGFDSMLRFIGLSQQKRIVASTENEDLTLPEDCRKFVEASINSIPDIDARRAVFSDFCVLRLGLYEAYCQAVDAALDQPNGAGRAAAIQDNPALNSAKNKFTLFLDQKNLFKGSNLNDASAWLSSSFLKLANFVASPVSFLIGEIAVIAGFVTSWFIGFAIDIAFIFILVTLPLRVISTDSPAILATPFIEVAAITFFSICTMFFRALGLYFIFKATDTSTAALNAVSFNSFSPSEPTQVYLWIGVTLVTVLQVFGSWTLTKMCFPNIRLSRLANSVYGGGTAVAGGLVAAGGAVFAAVAPSKKSA